MTCTINNVYNAGFVFGMSDDTSYSGSIAGLLRLPALLEDGVAPIYVTNAMDVANENLSLIGNIGALENSTVKFAGLYTTKGASVIHYDPTVNGGTFVQQSMVTVSSCGVAGSDEATLTALVASDTTAWSMVDGAPTLTYFADVIAGAPAILEALQPAETEAPETTEAPEETTEAPEVTEAPEATEAKGDEDEEDEKPEETKATTKAPAATPAPAEDGAPVGLIIGIVAAVVVVAAIVVIVLKKKKN